MNSSPLLKLALVLIGLFCSLHAGAAPLGGTVAAAEPAITAIRLDGKEVIVSVQVPPGLRKIMLQSSRRLGAGAWEPRSVMRLNGEGGEVTFRVARSPEVEILRVRADESEPLPSLFYEGTNDFPGVPIASGFVNPGLIYFRDSAEGGGGAPPDANQPDPAQRDVVESDIWQIRGDTLFFFNQYRGLQAIDISNPDEAVVRATLSLPAAGEQMYLLGDSRVVLLARNGCGWAANSSSQVLVVNTSGGALSVESSLPFEGEIQESRLVGTALYIMTQLYRPVADKDSSWEWGTAVYAFDLANPASPVARPSLWYAGYGNVLTATDRYLFIGVNGNSERGEVQCIDISAPDGVMAKAASIPVAGRVPDKFKMNLDGEIFTVISEQWATSTTGRWRPVTKLETFSLADPATPRKLGELALADGEQLHATRFDGNRVYVVTFFRVDPLWVVDLSDPTNPAIKGELHVPGWSTYIQPYGDRLVAIGIDDTNSWRVAVSLFDVQNPAAPALLSKVPLGENSSWSEANSDEKAFGFLPEAGLILVPYSSYSTKSEEGVQLIDFSKDALVKRGFISHDMQARRSTLFRDRVLSISGRELLTVDASDRDKPVVRSEVELAWPVNRVFVKDGYLLELDNGNSWTGSVAPNLRVVRTTAPDQVLNSLSFTNLPLAGAELRDGQLYLLQATTTYFPVIVTGEEGQPKTEGTNRTDLVCSVIDVSKLPALALTGSTALSTTQSFFGSATAVWPKTDLLVWVAQQANYWRPWIYADVGVGASLMPDRGGMKGLWYPFWYPYYGNGESDLFAVDTSNASAPRFVSEVKLGATDHWGSFSEPMVADGSVFLSEQFTETTITGTNYVVSTNVDYTIVTGPSGTPLKEEHFVTVTNARPVYISRQIYWLHVVDFAVPAAPVARQPITIPGVLRGISSEGALLYLVGYKLDPELVTDGSEWLYGCAYDGVAAHLVDSVPLPKEWPHAVLALDRQVYISRPPSGANIGRALEIWAVTEVGKFAKLRERGVGSNISGLFRVSDLLVAQGETGLELFDLTKPTELPEVGKGGPSGCLGWNIEAAAGSRKDGLWLPLDLYGVYQIPVEE